MFENKLHKKYLKGRHYVIFRSKINACEEDKRGHSSSFYLYIYIYIYIWRVWVRRGGCIGSWWGNRGEELLVRPRRRWVDNIRMDLQEVGCGYMDWIGLAQDRNRWRTLVSAVMNLRVP